MTGPGIVDTIAEVLNDTPYESVEDSARAVLAALTEAGTVEWATEHFDVGRNTWEMHPWPNEKGARRVGKARCARVVSRLTLPWTSVQ